MIAIPWNMHYLRSRFYSLRFYSSVSRQVKWICPECGRYAAASSQYARTSAHICTSAVITAASGGEVVHREMHGGVVVRLRDGLHNSRVWCATRLRHYAGISVTRSRDTGYPRSWLEMRDAGCLQHPRRDLVIKCSPAAVWYARIAKAR